MKLSSIRYSAVFIALVLCLLGCSSKETNKVVPSQEVIDGIKLGIASLTDKLPVECGYGMVMTQADFDDTTNTINYKYQYTIAGITKPTAEKIESAKKVALTMANEIPEQKQLLEDGITYHYDYYSLEDEFLYSIEVSPEDLKNVD